MHEYENTRRIIYGEDRATFIPVCTICCRFVKPDPVVFVNDLRGLSPSPNATCSKYGRTHMLFEGFF